MTRRGGVEGAWNPRLGPAGRLCLARLRSLPSTATRGANVARGAAVGCARRPCWRGGLGARGGAGRAAAPDKGRTRSGAARDALGTSRGGRRRGGDAATATDPTTATAAAAAPRTPGCCRRACDGAPRQSWPARCPGAGDRRRRRRFGRQPCGLRARRGGAGRVPRLPLLRPERGDCGGGSPLGRQHSLRRPRGERRRQRRWRSWLQDGHRPRSPGRPPDSAPLVAPRRGRFCAPFVRSSHHDPDERCRQGSQTAGRGRVAWWRCGPLPCLCLFSPCRWGAAPAAAPAFLIFAFGGGCPTTKRHARPCVLVGSASLAAHRAPPSERLELFASPPPYAYCLPPPPPLRN